MSADPYMVLARDGVIEAWSTERLKFEVKNTWHQGLREELRLALRRLSADPDSFLKAVYASPVRESCDTENILFYNVGPGAFAGLAERGLRFERGYVCQEPPQRLVAPAHHYHRYEFGQPGEGFSHWQETSSIVRLQDVVLPGLAPHTKPALVWLPVRRALVEATAAGKAASAFALRLDLRFPAAHGHAASVIKPLVDGVVSAFHSYQGVQLGEVSNRLASQLRISTAEVAALLEDPRGTPLGPTRLVVPRASGVQWFPADDACVACELVVNRVERIASPVLGLDLRTVTIR